MKFILIFIPMMMLASVPDCDSLIFSALNTADKALQENKVDCEKLDKSILMFKQADASCISDEPKQMIRVMNLIKEKKCK